MSQKQHNSTAAARRDRGKLNISPLACARKTKRKPTLLRIIWSIHILYFLLPLHCISHNMKNKLYALFVVFL